MKSIFQLIVWMEAINSFCEGDGKIFKEEKFTKLVRIKFVKISKFSSNIFQSPQTC